MWSDLYQELVLEHYRRPQNVGVIEEGLQVENSHPVCGDQVLLSLLVIGNVVEDVKFKGQGCSISQASLSMMTEAIKGRSLDEVRALYQAFRQMIRSEGTDEDLLEDLVAFQGVGRLPARVPCAMLGWETLAEALDLDDDIGEPSEACGPS